MEITTCTGNFFLQNNIFSNGSQCQKIARIRKKFIAENPKSSKQTFDLYHVTITNRLSSSLLTRFHMETMVCFTVEQLYQWRFVTLYYRHFPPDRLKSRSYQINSRQCWPEYWLSHTFKHLKLFHINRF